MILFTILALMLVILLVVLVLIISVVGASGIILFGDVFVCMFIIVWIMRCILKKKKRK